ncbi:hypothetical protein [Algoriphagus sp. NG3]|uniref:hypothetical protein n=1 Tax=Algoriphagus sp. NG3 TaxID=3097546 RepID=UPI002A81B646|nr:hypothetical protein [Algoriphagus sp. NG3]WPR75742.1 hypothetical protein SLW71_00060 [Algoriphagus sp. NG3]
MKSTLTTGQTDLSKATHRGMIIRPATCLPAVDTRSDVMDGTGYMAFYRQIIII